MGLIDTVRSWQGTDAALLADLNTARHKVTHNTFLTIAGVTLRLGDTVAAQLNLTLKTVADQLLSSADLAMKAQGLLIEDFREKFARSDTGVDFSNDILRAQLQGILTQAGWPQQSIDALLALGYTLQSDAQLELGRDATANDLTAIRAEIATQTLDQQYKELMNIAVYDSLHRGNRADLVAALRAVADGLEA